jgi:hypothetical protein
MLGYGQKTLGIPDKVHIPGVGTYDLKTDINPELNKQKSFTFGVSRDVCIIICRKWNWEDH